MRAMTKNADAIIRMPQPNVVMAEIIPESCAASTASCAGCGMCGRGGDGESYLLSVSNPGFCWEGQKVRVRIHAPNQALAGIVLFALPLGLAFAGGAASALLLRPASELTTIFCAAGGLALGFLAVNLLQRTVLRVTAEII